MNKIVKKKYEHFVDINTEFDIERNETYNLYIVYYVNCSINSNYYDWIINQINLVKNYNATIYIVATIEKIKEDEFKKYISELFPDIHVECYYENEFEYRGILKVWELGQLYNNKNDIIFYFHSKGVTHSSNYESHKNDDYNIVLKDIDLIKEIFTIFPKIDKVGFLAGGIGWLWSNFWYARGSYIYTIEKPLKTTRRHYYEDWLARTVENNDKLCNYERCNVTYYKNTLNSCYALYCDKNKNIRNIGSYFDSNTNIYYNFTYGNTKHIPTYCKRRYYV
jgi:hypothetical protein